ncbi:hypothetical protein HK096_004326 [Nowakowskiella sp. JEL0078]|nr:hypothetical protein HK096_004326 [Nowakowskiella sp. JEL0078]
MIPRPIQFPQHRPTQQQNHHQQQQMQQVQIQQVQQQQLFYPQAQFTQQHHLPQQQVMQQQQQNNQQYQQPIQMYINQPTQLSYENSIQYIQQQNNQLNQQLFQLQAQQAQLPSNLPSQFQQQSTFDPSTLQQFPVKQEFDTTDFSIPSEFLIADNDPISVLNPSPSHLSADFTNIMSPLSTSPLDPPDFGEPVDDFSVNGSGASFSQPPFGSTPIDMKSRTSTINTPNSLAMPKIQNATFNPGFYSMSMPVKPNGYGINGASSYESLIGGFSDLPLEGSIDSFVEMNGDNSRLEIINERRRRRRESHNAVERRRRDNINEKIQELATLLPDLALDAQNKPNKGIILHRSVDYIRHIQSYTMKLEQRHRELENAIKRILPGRESELGVSFMLGSAIDIPPYYTPGQNQQATPPPPTLQQQQQFQLEQMQFHQKILGLSMNGQQQTQQLPQ